MNYVLLSRLLRPEPIPDYRLSLFYDGQEYRPGERIELGSSRAFTKKTIAVIARNTGKFGFVLNPNGPPLITSSTSGHLQIEAVSEPPTPWEPGEEITLQIQVAPDGIAENFWKLTIQATEPSAIDFSFDLSMLSLTTKPRKLFFSAGSPVSGLFSMDWNPTTRTLESEVQHISGSAYLIAQAQRNKFIYYKDSATGSLIGRTLDSSGNLQNILSVAVPSNFVQFQEIETKNRLLALSTNSDLATMTFDPDTGGVSSIGPTIGTSCYSSNIFASPKGDFVLQPFPSTGVGRVQASRVESNGSLTNPQPYYQDANQSNRLDRWFKTFNNDFLYAFTAINNPTPPVNFKIDSVLRRTLNSDGSISNVNAEYTLNSFGARYIKSVRHPNDKFIYLLGYSPNGSNPGFIKVLNHNIETGEITVVQDVEKGSTFSASEGAVSPDGTLLATIFWINNNGICPATCLRMFVIYEINPSNGSLTEIYSLQQSRTLIGLEWLGSSN
ncbi:hypothetical protein [Leptospira sp. GIMC2001]|uniref:hypothetical protein n=1 Tax=Leptospira sp. GIMC2001 TaxID=1513297 RepID=UPI00234B8A13|nr:hypothetical protein [Leptospira sp. GIMC2001]WCL49059.1 hypothetical protein O4O04_17485 [Leptospira sp. GIMC2001]